MFLIPSDFVGKFQLHRGMYDIAKIETYIERYEKKYLVQLLGVELYNELISDLGIGNVPESPNLAFIFNPFIEQLMLNDIAQSEGILDMLKGFIYFEYAKDLYNQMTPFGQVMPTSENSQNVSTLNNLMYTRYNESVKTFRAIQAYVLYNQGAPVGQVLSFWFPNIGQGYTENYYQVEWTYDGPGTGFICDVKMSLLGGITYDVTVLTGGSGYNPVASTVTGGSGNGGIVVPFVDSGEVTSISVTSSGENYTVGDVLTINGGDNGATISLNAIGSGNVSMLTNIKQGINYTVGDLLELNADDEEVTNAILEVLKVGIGDYRKFRGRNLEYCYWL
jgi:hypothetical protein